jgi:glutamate synthase (NADPH) large chain
MTTRTGPGLYAPGFEHDSCGFGLIACLDDHASSWLVQTSLNALARLGHRGAVGADGLSGDGCGVLLHRADAFMRNVIAEAGISLPTTAFTLGTIFLPQAPELAAQTRALLTAELARVNVTVLGWRVVPVETSVCGSQALASIPLLSKSSSRLLKR